MGSAPLGPRSSSRTPSARSSFAAATTYCSGRDRVLAFVKNFDSALAQGATKGNLDKAQAALDQAKAVNAKAKVLVDLERKLKAAREGQNKVGDLLAKATDAWNKGDAEGALKIVEQAVVLAPTNNKDLQGAILFYKKALELCPQFCPAMNNIGVTYEALGDKKAAKSWMDAAVRCNPNNDMYKKNSVRIMAALQSKPRSRPRLTAKPGSFDGVYIGKSIKANGKQTEHQYTWTISGAKISVVMDDGKWRATGDLRPNGEFVAFRATELKTAAAKARGWNYRLVGKVAGNSISGKWEIYMSLLGGPEHYSTNTFWANRVK